MAGKLRVERWQMMPIAKPFLSQVYSVFNERVLIETDEQVVLDAATASFGRYGLPTTSDEPLRVRILRSLPGADSSGLSHQTDGRWYLGGIGPDLMAVNGEQGSAIAFVSDETLHDQMLLRYAYIEALVLLLVTRCRGYVTVHASGVAKDGAGVALHGPAGAGKSTLAVAAARRGLQVFAEDAVFVHVGPSGLEFSGLPWTQRFVQDARRFFPEFDDRPDSVQVNGELKVELDLDEVFPGSAVPRVRPAAVLILDRDGTEPLLRPAEDDALVEAQWPWGDHWLDAHERAARLLAELPAYRLTVGGTPDDTIDEIESLLDHLAGRR